MNLLYFLLNVSGATHEQNRPDRNAFVSISKDKVLKGKRKNFRKEGNDKFNSRGTPYDYHSVLHYGANEFSLNNAETVIVPFLPGVKIM